MGLQLASDIVPAGTGTYYLMEDIYLKGGLQVRATKEERDGIPIANLKLGALVLTLDDKKLWQVDVLTVPSRENPDAVEKVEWKELALGGGAGGGGEGGEGPKIGKRVVIVHTVDDLAAGGAREFELELGASSIVLKLETSRPVRIRAFGDPTKEEINPYEFISTPDHLIDDGRQLFEDGTILRTRNYSILANFEEPVTNTIYWTVDSVDEETGPLIITVTFLALEISDTPKPDDEVVTTPPVTP